LKVLRALTKGLVLASVAQAAPARTQTASSRTQTASSRTQTEPAHPNSLASRNPIPGCQAVGIEIPVSLSIPNSELTAHIDANTTVTYGPLEQRNRGNVFGQSSNDESVFGGRLKDGTQFSSNGDYAGPNTFAVALPDQSGKTSIQFAGSDVPWSGTGGVCIANSDDSYNCYEMPEGELVPIANVANCGGVQPPGSSLTQGSAASTQSTQGSAATQSGTQTAGGPPTETVTATATATKVVVTSGAERIEVPGAKELKAGAEMARKAVAKVAECGADTLKTAGSYVCVAEKYLLAIMRRADSSNDTQAKASRHGQYRAMLR
jgi:hypothetical protein